MRIPRASVHGYGGFTLVELSVATAILALTVALLAAIVGQVNKAWVTGEQKVESFQNGRAVLELIQRELSQAVISNKLQFIQNPPDLSGGNDLTSMLPANNVQVPNSDSIFWQMPYAGNSYGDVCEVGYMLGQNTSVKPARYQVQRYYVEPDNLATNAAQHKFRIYDGPGTYSPAYAGVWPLIAGAPWLTKAQTGSLTLAQVKTNFQSSLSVLSDGVVAMWVRCLDQNGDPIPWLYTNALYSSSVTTPVKFNSAAAFCNALPGSQNGFQYSDPASTLQSDLLPNAVELTIITVDSRTLNAGFTIPVMPSGTQPSDIPGNIAAFSNSLVANHISSARVFSTTVRLVNSGNRPITR